MDRHRVRFRFRPGVRWTTVVVLFASLPLAGLAQNEEDALRISNYQPGGTGRSTGMANAFGALGADGVSIGINPAGMGLYRTTELSFTPSLEVNEARSTYYGTTTTDSRTQFHFNNFQLAVHNPSKRDGIWKSSTYGIAFDRQDSHHWDRKAIGEAVPSTIIQGFVNEAAGTPEADLYEAFPFTSFLAWDVFAMDVQDTIAHTYVGAIPFGSNTRQQHTITSKGASSNTAFYYAGSILDRVYIGASLGIAGHRYTRTTAHTETTLDESLDLKEVSYVEDLSTSGNGVDINVGIIGRVSDRVRLGASYQSPQWMSLSDAYVTSLVSTFRTPDANGRFSYSSASPDGFFDYRVNTPWRMVLSAAYVAGANGLVSVDYTYYDPRKMRMKPSDGMVVVYDFAAENQAIQNSFAPVHSIRAGTEWRHGHWYYRLGWGYVPNAYRDGDVRQSTATRTYAGGLGYRTDHLGVDLGMNVVQGGLTYYPYAPELVQPVYEDRWSYRTMLTLSFRP